jgi:hypothetical protein
MASNRFVGRALAPMAVCACLFLSGCGESVSGTYAADGNLMTMNFKGGGKVTVSAMGDTKEGTYKVDGNKVIVTMDGEAATFVKQKDGSLAAEGGMLGVTLKKQK